MFSVSHRFAKVFARRHARRSSHRTGQDRHPTQGRRLAMEPLEDRRLLSAAADNQALQLFDASPALFVKNQGQWGDDAVRYAFYGSGANVLLTDAGPVFQTFRREATATMVATPGEPRGFDPLAERGDAGTQSEQFSVHFEGANHVTPVGLDQAETVYNYFVGDRSHWQTAVPAYQKAAYEGLYSGIDLQTWGRRDSLKYEFHVAPGADYRQIQVSYEGIEGLSIDSEGALHVKTLLGELTDDAPFIYQQIGGLQVAVAGQFQLLDADTYTFLINGDYDPRGELVIDPNLAWATYVEWGGSGVAVDSSGNAMVTGATGADAFVAKVTSGGTLAWATYLGGSGGEGGGGIALDSSGNALVIGTTTSTDFARMNNTHHGGTYDGFVAKVSSDGTLAWATYLGGTGGDYGYRISVDGSGSAMVTGPTLSTDFVGVNNTSHGGVEDAFVAKVTSAGTLAWATYLGGTGYDVGQGIAADSSGNALVTGYTNSGDFAGSNNTLYGIQDAFVAKVTSVGALAWATYLGGTAYDYGLGIAVDSSDNAMVTGPTLSTDFAGVNNTYHGSYADDAFVAKVTGAGVLAWATFLGGTGFLGGTTGYDVSQAIAVDSSGNALVTGYTNSTDFEGANNTYHGGYQDGDAFVAKVTSGGTLAWATYLGGSSDDEATDIAVDSSGNALVTGYTWSTDFEGANNTYHGGTNDAFVAKITGDTTPPTVAGRVPVAGGTIAAANTFVYVTFSEAVQGVDATDLVLGGPAAAVSSVAAPENTSGTTWRFPVSGLSSGSLSLTLAPDAHDIQDLSGNDLAPTSWTSRVMLGPGRIAFVSDRDWNPEIYVMNADGSNQIRLTNGDPFDGNPAFSPDGSKIVFMSDRDGNPEIYVMNADGTNQVRLTDGTPVDRQPAFSPDGSMIAFVSERDGNSEIYVMNAEGSNQIRLTNGDPFDGNPAFSPDGSKIVFMSERDGNPEIYVMNVDGSNQIRLTNGSPVDVDPAFSPDGSKIAFASDRDGNLEIYVMNADGTNQVRLTNGAPVDGDPAFSPEGNAIAFVSDRDGNNEIYVISADGTNPTRLTNNPAGDWQPSWGPVDTTPPTLDAILDPPPINEDAGVQTVSLSGITAGGGESQALRVTATSNNPALIPNPTVTYTPPNSTGSLSYAPAVDRNGASEITVTVWDAGLDGVPGNADDKTISQTFTVTVYKFDEPGLYDPVSSWFYLRNTYTTGGPDVSFGFGAPGAGWLPIHGDWDGNSSDTAGLYDPANSWFYLRNSNTTGGADVAFPFEGVGPGCLPLAGDWNGDGTDEVGVYDPAGSVFHLLGVESFGYGALGAGWLPIAGDWNGDGVDTIGLYDPATSSFYLRNSNTTGMADLAFAYGTPYSGCAPLAGDWNHSGIDTVGLYDPADSSYDLIGISRFYFPSPNITNGDWLPWNGAPPPPKLPQVQVIDDGEAGYTQGGKWTYSTGKGGYENDFCYSAKGDGSDSAGWTFTVTPGRYQVAATWKQGRILASNAPFSIYDGSTLLGTVAVNQKAAPNDFTDQGATWEKVVYQGNDGVFHVGTTTLTVKLTDNANRYVVADAIRIERVDSLKANATVQIDSEVAGAVPDADSNDITSVGLFDPLNSVFHLRSDNSTGNADYAFGYGEPASGWKPLVGDWNGDGADTVGFYDPVSSVFYVRNSLSAGYANLTFGYGEPGSGWEPLMGDWDGDGIDTVGFYDPVHSMFYLRDSLSTGHADVTFAYGTPGAGWKPLVGDWDGNGTDTIGLFDPQNCTWYLRDSLSTGFADYTFACGDPSSTYGHGADNWAAIVGNWDGTQGDGIGFFDPVNSIWMLRNSLTTGAADMTFGYGAAGAGWHPLIGTWQTPSKAADSGQPEAKAVDQIDLASVVAREINAIALGDLDMPLSESGSGVRELDAVLGGGLE